MSRYAAIKLDTDQKGSPDRKSQRKRSIHEGALLVQVKPLGYPISLVQLSYSQWAYQVAIDQSITLDSESTRPIKRLSSSTLSHRIHASPVPMGRFGDIQPTIYDGMVIADVKR